MSTTPQRSQAQGSESQGTEVSGTETGDAVPTGLQVDAVHVVGGQLVTGQR